MLTVRRGKNARVQHVRIKKFLCPIELKHFKYSNTITVNAAYGIPFGCGDIQSVKADYAAGLYQIRTTQSKPRISVFCTGDGWTVIQSRGQFGNPIEYFYRDWDDYVSPFGTPGKHAYFYHYPRSINSTLLC